MEEVHYGGEGPHWAVVPMKKKNKLFNAVWSRAILKEQGLARYVKLVRYKMARTGRENARGKKCQKIYSKSCYRSKKWGKCQEEIVTEYGAGYETKGTEKRWVKKNCGGSQGSEWSEEPAKNNKKALSYYPFLVNVIKFKGPRRHFLACIGPMFDPRQGTEF